MNEYSIGNSRYLTNQLKLLCYLLLLENKETNPVRTIDICQVLPNFLRKLRNYTSFKCTYCKGLCYECGLKVYGKKFYDYMPCKTCQHRFQQEVLESNYQNSIPFSCQIVWKSAFEALLNDKSHTVVRTDIIRYLRRIITNDYCHRGWAIYRLICYYIHEKNVQSAIDVINQYLVKLGGSTTYFNYIKAILSLNVCQNYAFNPLTHITKHYLKDSVTFIFSIDEKKIYRFDDIEPFLYDNTLLLTVYTYALYKTNIDLGLKFLCLLIYKQDLYNKLSFKKFDVPLPPEAYDHEVLIQLFIILSIIKQNTISPFIYQVIHTYTEYYPYSEWGYNILLVEVLNHMKGKQLLFILNNFCNRFEYLFEDIYNNEIVPSIVYTMKLILEEPEGEAWIQKEMDQRKWWSFYLFENQIYENKKYTGCCGFLSKYILPQGQLLPFEYEENDENREIESWLREKQQAFQSYTSVQSLFEWNMKYYKCL